jgi:hypothetical protein
MPRDSLTLTELAAVRRFLYAWREAITETGAVDYGYMAAAIRLEREHVVFRRVRRGLGCEHFTISQWLNWMAEDSLSEAA